MSAMRPSLGIKAVVPGLLLAVLAVAVSIWWASRDKEVRDPVPPTQGHPTGRLAVHESNRKDVRSRSAIRSPVGVSEDGGLRPPDVIDNPDCRMLAGRGAARDTALVVVPAESGVRMAALDGNGALFEDALPFEPHRFGVGKRADGTVVAGVGDLRLNSGVFREPQTPEPVRIYVGGQLVYRTEKAWNFGVASNGSSFYVQEPLAGGASRLLIRDLVVEHTCNDAYARPQASSR